MATNLEKEKQRLRAYLNKTIQGPNTNAILEALANGSCHLIDNVEAVNDNLYIATAKGSYLDELLAGRGVIRPENVGMLDETFRELGVEVSNRKQVRDLLMAILRIMYGEEYTRATIDATEYGPYALSDQDNLIVQFDDGDTAEIIFDTGQFTSIAVATTQEVSDAITKELRRIGFDGTAVVKSDDSGESVRIISNTDGPSSSVKILGGSAQNILRFPAIRLTTNDSTTQWTLIFDADGNMRATWSGGQDPSVGKVKIGDYVNIFGSSFADGNKGTFTIKEVQPGTVGNAYVEYTNPNGIAETVVQGTDDAVLFFNSQRNTIINDINYAAVYQFQSGVLEVIMPATTKVVRRNRIGAAHLHDSGSSGEDYGPYIFDEDKPYQIGEEEATTTAEVNPTTSRLIPVSDSTEMPDERGNLVFGFGTEREEGPVPYIARPSSTELLVDPPYIFKNVHPIGTNISLIVDNAVYSPKIDGSDYQFYLTDVVSGRTYAEELIQTVAAAGINVVITILYPGDEGLGKWNTNNSEKTYVWGGDPS